jgi:protein O-GlcNAc transferase
LPDTETKFLQALGHHEAGRLDEARALYRGILARESGHAESLHLLGLMTAQSGDPAAGIRMIMRAMGLAPGRAPHHNSLALAYRMLGRGEDAAGEYRAAAAMRPRSAEIRNNLAAVLGELGQHEEAVAQYRIAAECAPGEAEIWCNLADALAGSGDPAQIEACYRRAITLKPDFAHAVSNFARWLTNLGRWTEADRWLREAVRLAPDDARPRNNLGIVSQELGRVAEAEAHYRQALALDPGFAVAHTNLGCLLSGEGRADEAVSCHEAAIAADPLNGAARLALCMAQLPILYRTVPEIEARRGDYLAALENLTTAVRDPDVARCVAAAIGGSQPFFLPYQGRNDVVPQTVYGQLACRLMADAYKPAALTPRPKRGERIRLGIVSGFFQDHTIFKLFLEGWLTQIDRDRFEIIGFHTGRVADAQTALAASWCDRFVSDRPSAAAWRQAVSDVAPHVLLYPEIGMDPVAGRLAAQRLAPVQCVAWGHPETTGMPTIDYFLSAALMEPPDADAHYTEHLIRLPNLGLYYVPDDNAGPPLDRASLGLDPAIPVYWSGQALYKYSPEYDTSFPCIAAAVGHCQFVFIGFAKSAAVTAAFRKRLDRAFASEGMDASRYCVMLPPMPQHRFIAAVGAADVILDTPGWSGGKSTLDCLAHNPAIVTLPGPFMRGRHTTAILARIGCEETITGSPEEYIAIAARLGLDTAWRERVRGIMAAGKHRAFRDTATIRALEDFLTAAVAGDTAHVTGAFAPPGTICRA